MLNIATLRKPKWAQRGEHSDWPGDRRGCSHLQSGVETKGSLGDNDQDSFEPVANRKGEMKAQQASESQARVPGLVKPKPLVMKGASEKLKDSALEFKKVLWD